MRVATASSNRRSSRQSSVRTATASSVHTATASSVRTAIASRSSRTGPNKEVSAITTTPIYVIVQLTPTDGWGALARPERTRWVEDRFAQLAESFADDESGPLWSRITEMHTTRGIERSVVMLWRIADDAALDGLGEILQRQDVTDYFGVATIGGFHADDRTAIMSPLVDV